MNYRFKNDVKLKSGQIIKAGTVCKLYGPRNTFAVGITEEDQEFMVHASDVERANVLNTSGR